MSAEQSQSEQLSNAVTICDTTTIRFAIDHGLAVDESYTPVLTGPQLMLAARKIYHAAERKNLVPKFTELFDFSQQLSRLSDPEDVASRINLFVMQKNEALRR